ncbi:ABC transporter ATP-binding protein [Chachezhania sediminis]|uniref:ABC transporter ATP-binding protein n=1 Tax=Chachezhania sediminis TaxID=2599291 RepID=UPI00131BBECE|nr:ABC transporter ATP-binding protein [Chachezhania sediminis]
MILEAQDLGWSVSGADIVDGVCLSVREGETLGLIGPNGSGKSSLLKMLAGIRRPGRGQVRLDGRPMADMGQRAIAQNIALVEQQADTGNRITVRDAVELGRTPWLSALQPWSSQDDAIVGRALDDVGMGHMAGRYWHTLSGGERQRVHIARALAQEPRILMLDEPTNHLDIHHQLSILHLVRALPVTVVVALHDLNQAMDCDRIAVMSGGRLMDQGAPDAVLTETILSEIFDVRARFLTDPVDGARIMRFQSGDRATPGIAAGRATTPDFPYLAKTKVAT